MRITKTNYIPIWIKESKNDPTYRDYQVINMDKSSIKELIHRNSINFLMDLIEKNGIDFINHDREMCETILTELVSEDDLVGIRFLFENGFDPDDDILEEASNLARDMLMAGNGLDGFVSYKLEKEVQKRKGEIY